MKTQGHSHGRTSLVAVLLLRFLSTTTTTAAFQPHFRVVPHRRHSVPLLSSQWDEEESSQNKQDTVTRISFDEADSSLRDEETQQVLDKMGDLDSNPTFSAQRADAIRAAIRARATDMGIERKEVSDEEEMAAAARAKAAMEAERDMSLDLTQISSDRLPAVDPDMPSILYDAEEQLTDEEKAETDPVGELPLWEQVKYELGEAEWPSTGEALQNVAILIVVIAISSVFIYFVDTAVRELWTSLGFIPRPEDIMSGSADMQLPEGWFNNMNEEDILNFQNEIAGSKGSVSVPDVSSMLPDASDLPEFLE